MSKTTAQRRRALFAGAAISAAFLAWGGAASATTTIVTNIGLIDTYTATITDTSFTSGQNVYLTPLVLNGSTVVFCIDPYHDISTGSVNYTFNSASLSTNSDGATTGTGTALVGTQVGQIGALVNLGQYDVSHGNLVGASAAQGAIWEILGATVTANSGSPTGLAADISVDLAYAQNAAFQRQIGAIYDKADNVQGFASSVPEPSAWLMLFAGFGLIGGILRRRRAAASLANEAAALVA